LAQEDYFYEIQLSNKQLVFYFMALATGLIMSFLAGVMVGRGVDDRTAEAAGGRAGQEERTVAEEKSRLAPPAATSLTYAQRLEGEKAEEALEKPKSKASPGPPAPVTTGESRIAGAAREGAAGKPSPRPEPPSAKAEAAVKPAPSGPPAKGAAGTASPAPASGTSGKASPAPAVASSTASTASPAPASGAVIPPAGQPASPAPAAGPGGGFAIQVGAFRDRAAADSIVTRLKSKGFGAYTVTPAAPDGLFNVRVGPFTHRADAEKAQAKLRDEEKLKPFIVKQ
jgi:DedD protein